MGQKGSEFVHYVPIVIKISKSITIQHLRREIHFSGWSVFEHYKVLMPPHNLLSRCDVIKLKFGQESTSIAQIGISRTDGDKRIKTIIYRNFEANILTSKYRFHKFWNFNPSSDIISANIGSKKTHICLSWARVDRRIKVIPKWNQADKSNIICGSKIKNQIHVEEMSLWGYFF